MFSNFYDNLIELNQIYNENVMIQLSKTNKKQLDVNIKGVPNIYLLYRI